MSRQDHATRHDEPRQVAAPVAQQFSDNDMTRQAQTPTPTQHDQARHVATSDMDARYMSRLESEVDFLRGQVATKDAQIKELTERSRETNVLIGGLQRMLSPLLGSPDRHHAQSPFEDRAQQ
jgi:hypothetical protein